MRIIFLRTINCFIIYNFDFRHFAPCNERHELCECYLACSCNADDNSVIMWVAENMRDTRNALNCKIEDLQLSCLCSARKMIVNEAIVYVISCFFLLWKFLVKSFVVCYEATTVAVEGSCGVLDLLNDVVRNASEEND